MAAPPSPLLAASLTPRSFLPSRLMSAPETASPGPIVIGTAGHVDHGKSALVQALTGIDPDRLAEEKARSMTIELGFAWLTLPSGRAASIIDVPGHERFIKTMLAGAGGIDAALLVIAADEGPMPQTLEHLAILELLGIEQGVIVISKVDLVGAEWLAMVGAEIEERLAGTPFAEAPVLPVSARTGAGLDRLRAELDRLAGRLPPRTGGLQPRLPVDRVFTMAGFGTVVTGTLGGGELSVGQDLRLFPGKLAVRVRGLQTHGRPVDRSGAGSRVAVNLAGTTVEQVRRGDVLAPPGLLTPSLRLDARVRVLAGIDWRLVQSSEVDFFTGAAEAPARVTLLDRDALDPGDEGWVQLRFRVPVAALAGDRFVLRRPSPSDTIGGGVIVNATPPRHRRFRPEVVQMLTALATGIPTEVLLAAVRSKPLPLPLQAGGGGDLTAPQLDSALVELRADGRVAVFESGVRAGHPTGYVVTAEQRQTMLDGLRAAVASHHERYPLRRGMPVEELRRIGTNPELVDVAIATFAAEGLLVREQATVRLPEFRVTFTPIQQAAIDRFLVALHDRPYAPPPPATFGLTDEQVIALEQMGHVVRVSPEIVLSPAAVTGLVEGTLATIDREGSISLAQFRDQFQTTRKYAQVILEYLDRKRITRRDGDVRFRFTAPGAPVPTVPPAEQ